MAASLNDGRTRTATGIAGFLFLALGAGVVAAQPSTPSAAPSTAQGAPAALPGDGVSRGSAAYYGSADGSPAERAAQARRDADRRRFDEAQDRFYADEQARAKARTQGFDSKSTDYYKRP